MNISGAAEVFEKDGKWDWAVSAGPDGRGGQYRGGSEATRIAAIGAACEAMKTIMKEYA